MLKFLYLSWNYRPPTAVDWFTAEDIAIVWRGISFKKDTINEATTEGWISNNPRYKASDAVLTVSLSLYPTKSKWSNENNVWGKI